jgi:hypothetical protein
MLDVLLRVKIDDEVHRDYLENQITKGMNIEGVKLLRHAFKDQYLVILIRVKEQVNGQN